jgi:hypothetical protein
MRKSCSSFSIEAVVILRPVVDKLESLSHSRPPARHPRGIHIRPLFRSIPCGRNNKSQQAFTLPNLIETTSQCKCACSLSSDYPIPLSAINETWKLPGQQQLVASIPLSWLIAHPPSFGIGNSSYQWESRCRTQRAARVGQDRQSSECADFDSFPGCAGFTVCLGSLPMLSRICTIAFDKSSNLKEKMVAWP